MSHSLAQKVSLKPSLSPNPAHIRFKSDQNRTKTDQNRTKIVQAQPRNPKPAFLNANFYDFLAKTQIQSFHTGRKNVLQLIYVIQIFVKSRLSNRIQRTVKSMVLMLLMLHAVLMAGFSFWLISNLIYQKMSEFWTRPINVRNWVLKCQKRSKTVGKFPWCQ